MAKVRVMVVDDSLVFREFLSRAFREAGIEVVGAFGDPLEALNSINVLQPDVITVDMEMPHIRGNEFIRKIRPIHPHIKAVVISSLSGNVFDAMQAGAIDFVGKPGSRQGYDQTAFLNDIIQKINIAATATVKSPAPAVRRLSFQPVAANEQPTMGGNLQSVTQKSIVAIGASTGGTEAILEVIKNFPANMPGVVIVQHMPPGFTNMYAERADKLCAMKVREAKNGDKVERGTALIAPGGDQHMRLRQDIGGYSVTLTGGDKVNGHCPSVDVLFESVAMVARNNAVGVILTGMGADGARNLGMMRQAGAHTIGQDKDSCIVYGMPKVAYEIGSVTQQLPLSAIGGAVIRHFSK